MGTRTIVAAVVAVLLALLTGCSSADSGAQNAGEDAASGYAADAEEGVEGAAAQEGGDEAGSRAAEAAAEIGEGSVATDGEAPLMVRRVELEVVVEAVDAAVTRARATVTGAGGYVSSEDVRPGTEDRGGYGSLVLRVPSAELDPVVATLGELGQVQSSSSSADDVTTEYRDVEARIATLEAGATRLRDLVEEAPDVESIAGLERELSTREAELDALKARMQVLADDVARSTITLHLAEASQDLDEARPDTGFVAGLQQGWDAFAASVTVLLTLLGALLPFLVVLGVILVPVLWWWRRRHAASSARSAAPSAPQARDGQTPEHEGSAQQQ
ncbi:hypothetical protein BJF80_07465 [Serinicoccus sp. CUA-874]|uniref:DUF4349 domain-containing protein n=1 Tax=Serinicoccus sp. CUA-874 TaxID=1517939 RepID=UPI0009671901|nr:DUF4349 domain-containing protein [Serinicoccus sp. CUA-874]OLT16382.1 hypothetical protein BJF80_07465 [Serinicoccus sp. CUA-874]